jgi:hypothetical protein
MAHLLNPFIANRTSYFAWRAVPASQRFCQRLRLLEITVFAKSSTIFPWNASKVCYKLHFYAPNSP